MFICPICKGSLKLREKSLYCDKGHCYDLSKQGYVNLLQNGGSHGDNRAMVKARKDFLSFDFYRPLADKLSKLICANAENGYTLLDCGCGDGYYTRAVEEKLAESNIAHRIFAVDVSKDACGYCARAVKSANVAVASVYALPIEDKSVDIVFTLFAPSAPGEYSRVLKNDGLVFMVIPGENHLFGLKKTVYKSPYKNEVSPFELEGFNFVENHNICYEITLDKEQTNMLFAMTPYFYNTPRDGAQKLAEISSLTTVCEFEIVIFRKK